MRTLRGLLTTAVALAGLLPSVAEAQQGRRFDNAWFWGLKGGSMMYSTYTPLFDADNALVSFESANHTAPVLGVEWLITRSKGGLYVSYDQGILDEETVFMNSADPDSAVIRLGMKGTRRVNLAGMFFPTVKRWAQPYLGLGFSYMQVGSTELLNAEAFNEDGEAESFSEFVTENKAQFQPLAIVGAQMRLRPFSVFIQGSATPFNNEFILRGARTSVMTFELGVRYNIGSSIDRL